MTYGQITHSCLLIGIVINTTMCSIPPPPPLPAEKPFQLKYMAKVRTQVISEEKYNMCIWAVLNPELQDACVRNGIFSPPFKYSYKFFESILQIGPTCGIVALSMTLSELCSRISPEELLDIAQEKGYSNNGEMFSCKNMLSLIDIALSLIEGRISVELNITGLFNNDIIHRLLSGAVILIPYDADYNHSPCLKKGHTAHWALVCGIIVLKQHTDYTSHPEDVLVLCKHGKSKYLAVWRLDLLAASNENLIEMSPKRGEDDLTYILPEGGLSGENGLRKQFIIIDNFEY